MSARLRVLARTAAASSVRAAGPGVLLALSLLGASTLASCDLLQEGIVGDDTVDAGQLDLPALLRDCIAQFSDAGVRILEQERICIIAPFTENCVLRDCAIRILNKIEERCPPPDSGLLAPDPQFCESLANPLGGALP